MMETLVKLIDGYIDIRTGVEGPRHDPYGFKEITVSRKGHCTTIHEGLAEWVEQDGKRFGFHASTEVRVAFQNLVGFSPEQIESFVERAQGRCKKCGSTESHGESGYPGETLYVCDRCGHITGGSFNRSAIE